MDDFRFGCFGAVFGCSKNTPLRDSSWVTVFDVASFLVVYVNWNRHEPEPFFD